MVISKLALICLRSVCENMDGVIVKCSTNTDTRPSWPSSGPGSESFPHEITNLRSLSADRLYQRVRHTFRVRLPLPF
jgi:hypothetical protein